MSENRVRARAIPVVNPDSADEAVPVILYSTDGSAVATSAADTARDTDTEVLPVQLVNADGTVDKISTVSTVTTLTTLTGGGVADNGADSGNPVKVGTKYNASAPTYADGDRADLQSDINGNTKTTLATSLNYAIDSVTQYQGGCTMTEVDLSTDADVVVTASPCYLLGLYVNVVFSAHAVNIIDNVTTKLILPASLAAGTKIDCHSATFATNLSVNSDDSATGKLLVFWRAA